MGTDPRDIGGTEGSNFEREQERDAILEQLNLILKSEHFKGSKRCCNFLKYSVGYGLAGRPPGELKERVIGVEAFAKNVDYDTAQDNTVRVTANEVRKRLAQYYGDLTIAPEPIFHLSPGTYSVGFLWRQSDPSHAPEKPRVIEFEAPASEPHTAVVVPGKRTRWPIFAAGLLAAAVIVATATWKFGLNKAAARSTVREVWAPLLNSPKTVAISIVQPVAYRPVSDVDSDSDTPAEPNQHPATVPYDSIGRGDAVALADVIQVLSENRKAFQLLLGRSTPFQRLHTGSGVLIGNHTDPRLLSVMENQRFYFTQQGNAIHDRSRPEVKWTLPEPVAKPTEDYALVTRFANPVNGTTILILAGLTNAGTEAAGYFITNENSLTQAFQHAPKNWPGMNFQFVLHAKVSGNTVEQPTVVAAEFW